MQTASLWKPLSTWQIQVGDMLPLWLMTQISQWCLFTIGKAITFTYFKRDGIKLGVSGMPVRKWKHQTILALCPRMVWLWHCFVCVWETENKAGRKHYRRKMATTIRDNQQSMGQTSRSWRCIVWSFHFVIWRKEGNHTCEIEVIAGFSLRDLKVKKLAFNTGTRFDVKTTICM